MGTCCKAVLLNDSESTIDEAQLTGKESMAEGDEFEFGERFLVQMAKSYSPVATESVVMPQKRLSQLNVNASSSLQQPRRKKLNLGPKPRANECQNAHKTTQQPTAAYARPVMAERVCMQPSNVVLNNSHDDQPAFRVLEPKHMRSASDVLLLLQSPARPNAAHLNFHEDPFTSRQTKHANRPSAVPNHAKSDHGLGTITLDDLDGDDLCVQPDSTSAPPQSTFSVPDLASALHSKPAEKLQPRQKPRTPEKMHMLGGVRSVTCSRQQDHGNKQDHGNSALVSALPVEIAEEEEEDELLARMEARSKKAKGALRQTELGGMDHRQYREVNEPFSHTTAVHNQPAFQQQRNDGNQSNTIPDWNQPRLSSQPANNLPNNTHHNPVEVQFRPDMYASVGFSTLAQKVSAANQVKLGDTAHHTMQRKSRLVAPLKLKTNPRTIVFPNEAECTKPHAPAPEIPDLVGCGVKTYRCAFAAALYHELNHSVRHFAQRFHQVAADYHKTFGSAVGKQMVTFFRRKGIPIYSSFILDTGYDGPVRGGRKKDVPQKIYLKLENDTEKERSSDYTKGDLWFLERNNEKVLQA